MNPFNFKDKSLAPVWCGFATLMIAAAWLLPNHTQPWVQFHSDAWMAGVLAAVGLVVLARTQKLAVTGLDLLVASAALLPIVHFRLGLLPFAGHAWVSTAYLVGFLVAIAIGRQWQGWRPIRMGNILFGAFLIGSLVSVGLQIYQWFGLTSEADLFDIWVFGLAHSRPYANLGQPNQLATLLLWGILACGWTAYQRHVRPSFAFGVAVFLLLGLALTQSRSGFIGLCAVVAAAWWWRALWPQPRTALYVSALIPLYFLLLVAVYWASQTLLLTDPTSISVRTMGEMRPAVWKMLLDAAAQRPWLGYGWNEVLAAHLAVAENHPDFPVLFAHAHNLPLDFVIWAGFPAGLALTAALLAWVWTALRRVREPGQVLQFLMLTVLGLHAMLELPLQYGYFLLPAGLFAGALSAELKIWHLGAPSRAAWRAAQALLGAIAILLALIVYDYFEVEASTVDLRMKQARIWSPVPLQAPDVIVLTQLQAMLQFGFTEPVGGQSPQALANARDVTAHWITYANVSRLIRLLALNGHTAEARCWMSKAMIVLPAEGRRRLITDMETFRENQPQLETVRWPTTSEDGACANLQQARLGPWPQLGR